MKSIKFRSMAAMLCLIAETAFAGCNAADAETVSEETTTAVTGSSTVTEAETTSSEEETEAYESYADDDAAFRMPDAADAEDFENDEVAVFAQDCTDRDITIYAVDAETFDPNIDPDIYLEGFTGVGGSLDFNSDAEASDDADYVLVQCAAFASYDDAVAYADGMIELTSDDEIVFDTEETEDGYIFSVEIDDQAGTETIEGSVSPDGVFLVEVIFSGS